jgi:hypothetical protein
MLNLRGVWGDLMSDGTMHHGHEPDDPGNSIGIHGMLLVGEGPIYLSHLPMFMPRHNYQVILRVTLEDDVTRKLGDFRAHFGRDMLVTIRPESFALRDLLADDTEGHPLTSFRADVVKGHFEHGGDTLSHAALVRVDEIAYFEELDLGAADPDEIPRDLGYFLFGDADHDLFVAHWIRHRPNFDQVLRIVTDEVDFTEAEIERQGRPTVTIPGRTDSPEVRLKVGDVVAAHSSVGQHFHHDFQVNVLAEIYLNEDELR